MFQLTYAAIFSKYTIKVMFNEKYIMYTYVWCSWVGASQTYLRV